MLNLLISLASGPIVILYFSKNVALHTLCLKKRAMIMYNIFVATTLISAHCRSPLLVAVDEPSSPPKAIHLKSHIMSWQSATSSNIGLLSTTLNVRTVASYW